MSKCCVADCHNWRNSKKNPNPSLTYHRFPKDAKLIKTWLIKARRDFDQNKIPNWRICSDHFLPSDFKNYGVKKQIKPGSIPSVFKGRGKGVTPKDKEREERLKKRNAKVPPKAQLPPLRRPPLPPPPKVLLHTNCLICCESQLSPFPSDFDREFFENHFLSKFLFLDNDSELCDILQDSLFCRTCVGRLVEATTHLKTIEELQKRVYQLREEFDSHLRTGIELSQEDKDTYFEGRSKLAVALGIINPKPVHSEEVKEEEEEPPIEPDPHFNWDFLDEIPTRVPTTDPSSSQVDSQIPGGPPKLKKCSVSLKRMDLPQGQINFKTNDNTLDPNPLNSKSSQPQARSTLTSNNWDPKRLPIHTCPICQKSFYGSFATEKHKNYAHSGIGVPPERCFEVIQVESEPPNTPKIQLEEGLFEQSVHLVLSSKLEHGVTPILKDKSSEIQVESGKKLNCPKCPLKWRSQRGLNNHLIRGHKMTADLITFKTYICSFCQRVFKKKSNLKAHELIHTNTREFQCDKCPKRFNLPGNLRRHLESMHDPTMSCMCHKCGRTFRHPRYLHGHLNKCNLHYWYKGKLRGDFSCPNCEYRGRTEVGLKIHQLKHSSTSGSEFQCPEPGCDKVYPNIIKLRAHVYASHPSTKWFCKVCQKYLKNKGQFQNHERIHANLREFQCSLCPARFNTLNTLKRHELAHDKTKTPHKCPKCGKGFVLQKYLGSHLAYTKCKNRDLEASVDPVLV